jgi:hypothetical protein
VPARIFLSEIVFGCSSTRRLACLSKLKFSTAYSSVQRPKDSRKHQRVGVGEADSRLSKSLTLYLLEKNSEIGRQMRYKTTFVGIVWPTVVRYILQTAALLRIPASVSRSIHLYRYSCAMRDKDVVEDFFEFFERSTRRLYDCQMHRKPLRRM